MKAGFIGGGKMAEAIIAAVLKAKLLDGHEVFASDVSGERRNLLKSKYGINTYSKNKIVATSVTTLFICVKPQNLQEVMEEIAPDLTKHQLVISIVAGKKLSFFQSMLPFVRIIRVMPNLPALVSEGMSVFCVGSRVTEADKRSAKRLLASTGRVLELPEDQFDAVTALSGSGPAFFAFFMSLMVEAGVKEGLAKEDAMLLAEQTMLGTSKFLVEQKMDPSELIESVASAKGTTAAGLDVLKKSKISDIISETISAAARRSAELSAG